CVAWQNCDGSSRCVELRCVGRMTTPDDDWRTLLDRLSQRVRSIAGADDILRELELLATRYQEQQAQVILDAKRRMADLEELHNANRLVTVGTLTVGMAHEMATPL